MGSGDLICAFISVLMVVFTITVHYEIKQIIWNVLPKFRRYPRIIMNMLVLALMLSHTICIWAYGVVFWLLDTKLGIHGLGGHHENNFISYVYFSASTYSSLGFGDIVPLGPLRMLVGVEVVNGLLLIGLSVTLTYFAMERFWGLHAQKLLQEDNMRNGK